MFLETKHVALVPFDANRHWEALARWFYDEQYRGYFRHHPKAMTEPEFRAWPQIMGSDVFVICELQTQVPIGLVQLHPNGKTNRAFFIGILIDKKAQGCGYLGEVFYKMFDYTFNQLGYKKAIVEILESNEQLKSAVTDYGFLFEGKFFGECFFNGEYVNELRYCMMDTYFNKKYKGVENGKPRRSKSK